MTEKPGLPCATLSFVAGYLLGAVLGVAAGAGIVMLWVG